MRVISDLQCLYMLESSFELRRVLFVMSLYQRIDSKVIVKDSKSSVIW